MWLTSRRLGLAGVVSSLGLMPGCVHRDQPSVAPHHYAALPERVTVEVLNHGGATGAARLATMRLRDGRLDVVHYGTAEPGEGLPFRTTILERRGDTTGIGRVRQLLGNVPVVSQPDSTRLVNLTVVLGRDFNPPASLSSPN